VAVKQAWLRAVFFGCQLLLYFALIRTGSRGSFLAVILATAYMLWHFRSAIFRSPSAGVTLLICIVVGGLFLPAWLSQTSMGKRMKAAVETFGGDISKREGSAQGRLALKFIALEQSFRHPLFGLGRNCFWQTGRDSGGWNQTTHDNYLNTLVETGFPGFIFYYAIYA